MALCSLLQADLTDCCPNIALIHALKQARVDIRVCGQGLLGRKIDSKQVNPDIQIDLWAMTTLVNLQLKGYVRVG